MSPTFGHIKSRMTSILPLFFLFLMYNVHAQPFPSTIGYKCEANHSINPCQTYVVYRATDPDYLDLASIGDLFGVTRLAIAKATNISSHSPLFPSQLLLVPVKCSCNFLNNSFAISYAPLNYTIGMGDTLFSFQSLVTYESIHLVDLSTDRVDFNIGDEVVLPIFCKCPNSTQLQNQVKYLITYVFQPGDTLSAIASRFGSSEKFILEINRQNISPFDAVFIPVSQLPNFAVESLGASPPADALALPPPADALAFPPLYEMNNGFDLGLEIGLGICGVLLVLVCVVWCYREYQFKRMGGIYRDVERQKVDRRILKSDDEVKLMADVAGCLDKYKVFKIKELRKATKGFDAGLIIKGSVYRGCIHQKNYAIKKIKWDACEELKILQKVNHGNLVSLEGFCIDPDDSNCYVVYEYVENGSLYSWLHKEKNKRLSWNTRLRIAIDVANGLQYIHEHTRPKVVHKDIKSSNILLDSNMRAKIASFGLAKLGYNAVTMHIVGTRGYIAPEYLSEGAVSTKMDVFSFGVVLLELISAGEVIDEEGKFLWSRVDGILDGQEEGKLRKLREWMDGCLNEDSCTIESVMKVMVVAIACLHKDPIRRPNMEEIVYALSRNDYLVPFDVSQELHCPR